MTNSLLLWTTDVTFAHTYDLSENSHDNSNPMKQSLQLLIQQRQLLYYYYYYTVSHKKRPIFTTCYNFYIHSSTATVFGTNVAEKVGNHNVFYFPTTPN